MNSFFIDSNICIYAFDKTDAQKQQTAFELLGTNPTISAQVIIETYNACYRKLRLAQEVCEENTIILCDLANVFEVNAATIRYAIAVKKKYHLSFLDACIVAAAVQSGCSVLYSEDMQHNLNIDDVLTILNPFA